jgi:hypothetical protein
VSTPSDPRRPAPSDYSGSGNRGEHTFSLYAERAEGADSSGFGHRGFGSLVRRPPEMWAGAVFLTLAALPLLVLGVSLALQPGQFGTNLKQKITSAGTSMNADTLLTLLRVGGAVLLVLAVVFMLFTWQSVKPQRRARTVACVLAALEVVALVVTMVLTAPDPVSVGVGLLALAGAILLYLPHSEEFMRAHRS